MKRIQAHSCRQSFVAVGFVVVTVFLLLSSPAQAAKINYDGVTQNGNITTLDWVLGSKMWGSIETGSGTATSWEGLSSLDGRTPSLFTFTFGDLELSDYLEPTATSPGYEVYSEADGTSLPLQFFYDGTLWASGTLFDVTVHVENSNDSMAVGTATGQLTAAGVDSAFYNEVLLLTGGSGMLEFSIGDFYSIDSAGKFGSSGEITFPTAVPESGSTLVYAVTLFGLLWMGRGLGRK